MYECIIIPKAKPKKSRDKKWLRIFNKIEKKSTEGCFFYQEVKY